MESQQRTSRRTFLNQSACAVLGAAISPFCTAAFAQSAAGERFELSLHPFSLKKLFDSKQLELLKYPRFAKEELGISNIEFAVEFCSHLLDAPEKADEIRKESEGMGVKNRILLCGADPPLDGATSEVREAAVSAHLKWAKVAERLGCEFMRVRASTQGDRQKQLEHAAEGIGTLCDKLKSSSVSVLIENISEHSRDPSWLVELVKRIGTERVGLVADFGNFDGDIYDGMKQLLPYTKSICTKSWEFDAEGNETKIDFRRMMNVVKESKFRGCIAIEYLGGEPVNGVKKTAALINRHS